MKTTNVIRIVIIHFLDSIVKGLKENPLSLILFACMLLLPSCAEYPSKLIVDTPWGEASKYANVITVKPKVPLEKIKINVTQ